MRTEKHRESGVVVQPLMKPLSVVENGPYRTHASRPMPWGASGEQPAPTAPVEVLQGVE